MADRAIRAVASRSSRSDDPVMPIDDAVLEPVVRKLKLGPATRPTVLRAPDGFREALASALGRPVGDAIDGRHDWILLFARDRAALDASIGAASAAVGSPGTLWIAYPKGSSKIQTDLTRDAGWESVAAADLMWPTLVSIDDTWSAFSLRHYRPGEARQTFR
jgi:hypothetical protein